MKVVSGSVVETQQCVLVLSPHVDSELALSAVWAMSNIPIAW